MPATAGALHGIIQYERLTSSGEVSRKVAGEVTTGTITTVSRTSAPPDTFAGTWQGRYLVRTCDVSGWDTCYLTPVGDTAPLELVLSQAGNQVTGSVTVTYPPFAVSGEATGSMLQLAGSATYQNGQWTKIRRLLMFSATRDAVGRLTGTVTWQDEDIRPDGVKYLTTQSVELQAVVQVR